MPDDSKSEDKPAVPKKAVGRPKKVSSVTNNSRSNPVCIKGVTIAPEGTEEVPGLDVNNGVIKMLIDGKSISVA